MASEGFHEPIERLDEATLDRHRIIISIQEELEAIDWYDQRITATNDASLAAVLAHNRDEEKEHAAMGIEWLRRHDPTFDEELRTYLFTEGPITELEAEAMARDDGNSGSSTAAADAAGSAPAGDSHSLRIGSLKGHSATTEYMQHPQKGIS